jgi:hypothetical protein
MIRDHERIEELIVARALGALDGDDEREYARERDAHGAECAECLRLEAEYGEVAGRLAFSLDPEPVREELEERVVGFAAGSVAILERDDADGAGAPRRPTRRPGGVVLRPLVAVAAAAVLFVGGWAIGAVTSGDDGSGVPVDARVVALEGDGDGTLATAYRPGDAGVYVLGSGLQAPPEGQVYELWMIDDGTPIPGACVRPSPDGSVFAFVDAEVGTTDTMAVTVESADCPSAPTSDPIFVATLA